ncbi:MULTISPECIES: YqgQ family protein [unclassified Lysinibacillus]|uniref:YqgQ family protein n=1 Tax=unclassified Lysinibacillus TaxID=2636778 RepID=UPI0036EF9AFC
MKTMIDIYDLLKQFGIYIYTGDRLGDLELIEDEIKELFKSRMIEMEVYQTALLLIRQEERRLNTRN